MKSPWMTWNGMTFIPYGPKRIAKMYAKARTVTHVSQLSENDVCNLEYYEGADWTNLLTEKFYSSTEGTSVTVKVGPEHNSAIAKDSQPESCSVA